MLEIVSLHCLQTCSIFFILASLIEKNGISQEKDFRQKRDKSCLYFRKIIKVAKFMIDGDTVKIVFHQTHTKLSVTFKNRDLFFSHNEKFKMSFSG